VLKDGTEVPAWSMSDGLLYFLAFAAIAEVERPSILLVEEPENGLHPSRIREVVGILRHIAEDPERPAQVLMATHSPLVVNDLVPGEVTVVTRTVHEGTRVTKLTDTADFEERAKVYAPGELWLSYADGIEEKNLLLAAQDGDR
jgi:predicted ATPase